MDSRRRSRGDVLTVQSVHSRTPIRRRRGCVGSLELEGGSTETVVCDLVFDGAWRGALASRHFNPAGLDT